jgi:hypothetical protein
MIDLYFIGVGLAAMWMIADDFERFTDASKHPYFKQKYRLKDYAWRPFLFPYFLAKFLVTRINN